MTVPGTAGCGATAVAGAANGAADPGERVAIELAIENRGNAAALGVTARLAVVGAGATPVLDQAS